MKSLSALSKGFSHEDRQPSPCPRLSCSLRYPWNGGERRHDMACPVAQSFHIPTVLASCCRYNTLPPTQCLKTTQMYSLTVLEVVHAKLLQSCLTLPQPRD